MKALSKFTATAALLVVLATLPGMLIAFRTMRDQITTSVSHFASSVDEARFWAHAFGP